MVSARLLATMDDQVSSTRLSRHKWTREENIELLRCYYASAPDERGYASRLHHQWCGRNPTKTWGEQRLAGQVRSILRRKVFTDIELESFKSELVPLSHRVEPSSHSGSGSSDSPLPARRSPSAELELPAPSQTMPELSVYQLELKDKLLYYHNSLHEEKRTRLPPLRSVFHRKLKQITADVNCVLRTINVNSLEHLSEVLYCAAKVVTDECGIGFHAATTGSHTPQPALEDKASK